MSDPIAPGALARALALVQVEIRDPTRSQSGQVKGRKDYRYAGLSDLLATVRPTLARHGLAVSSRIVVTQQGPELVSELLHESGEVLSSSWPLAWPNGPQERGSELTYARRYTIEALVGVAPTDDDDGASAQDATERRDERRPDRDERPRDRDRDERPSEPVWSEADWTAELGRFGLNLDEVLYYLIEVDERHTHPADLTPERARKCLAWLIGAEGSGAVKAALDEVRGRFQRTFFPRWTLEFPEPRKSDGVSDEDRERAKATSERNRRAVFDAWYGVAHLADIPIRDLVKGPKGIPWLVRVTPGDFAAEVTEVLARADDGPADPTASNQRVANVPDDDLPF